jgi:hypothetical protein
MSKDEARQNPFKGLADEPAEAFGLTGLPRVLSRAPARQRRTPVRPSEKRRRARQMLVTFSDPSIPSRLRALTEHWGLHLPSGELNVSAVIEYLILPQLEEAEQGAIRGPGVWR